MASAPVGAVAEEIEWRMCERSARHFIETCWNIKKPKEDGVSPMTLWPYQQEFLTALESGVRRHLVLKARQIGFTTLMSAYVAWWAITKPESLLLYLSRGEREARDVVANMRSRGFANLPTWMLERASVANAAKEEIILENGSSIRAIPTKGQNVRGYTPDLVIMDEWAFFENPEEAWRSIQPAVADSGKMVAMSTARGAGTTYHRQWLGACRQAGGNELDQTEWKNPSKVGENGFMPHFFHFDVRPDRGDDFYDEQMRNPDVEDMEQEYPRTPAEAFIMAGKPYFPTQLVMQQGRIQDPFWGYIGEGSHWEALHTLTGNETPPPVHAWVFPEPGAAYIMGVDVAGQQEGGDNTSIHVLHEDGYVCAAWCGNYGSTVDFSLFLEQLAIFYNKAYVAIEVNGVGQIYAEQLMDKNYRNLYFEGKRLEGRWGAQAHKPGFHTNAQTKPLILQGLRVAMETGQLMLPCRETQRELSEFEHQGPNRMGAPKGGHDDRVMSLAIAVHAQQKWQSYPKFEANPHFPSDTTTEKLRRFQEMTRQGTAPQHGFGGIDFLRERHRNFHHAFHRPNR